MKKFNWYLLIVIITLSAMVVCAVPALAAAFLGSLNVINNTTTVYTYPQIYTPLNNTALINAGYCDANELDVLIKSTNGTAMPMMPMANNGTWFSSPTIAASSYTSFIWSSDNALKSAHQILVGNGGYVTTADAAALEPASNFTLELSGYIKASSNGDILDKQDAVKFFTSGGNFTVQTGNDAAPDVTLTAPGISSGVHKLTMETQTVTGSSHQILTGGSTGQASNTTLYFPVQGAFYGIATETYSQQVMPCDGTFNDFAGNLSVAPGVGESYTFTLNVNGVPSTLTFTINDPDVDGSDTTHSINVLTGDLVSIDITGSGGATAAYARFNSIFTPDTSGQTVQMGCGYLLAKPASTYYMNVAGYTAAGTVSPYFFQQVMPCAGTVSLLAVSILDGVAWGAGDSTTYTLYKNGAPTALTVTLTDPVIFGQDTTHSVSFVAGDLLSVIDVHGVLLNGGVEVSHSVVITPTNSGDAPYLFNNSTTHFADPLATNYAGGEGGISSGSQTWTAAENFFILAKPGTIKSLYWDNYQVAGAPPNAYDITFRQNGGDTSLVVGIAGAAQTTDSDTTHEITISDGDTLSYKGIPTSDPLTPITRLAVLYNMPNTETLALNLYIDDVLTDSASFTSIPDNANNWLFWQDNVMPFANYLTLDVSGVEVLYYAPITIISGTTLPDRAGAVQDGTFTWGTADLTASLIGFSPAAPTPTPTITSSTGFIPTPTPSGTFSTDVTPLAFPFADIIEDIKGTTPGQIPWMIITGFIILVISLVSSWIMRRFGSGSIFVKFGIILAGMAILVGLGVYDFWMIVIFIVIAGALMMASRQQSWN